MKHNIARILTDNVNGATFIGIDTKTQVKLKGGKKNPHQGRVEKVQVGSNVMVFQNKTTNGYENMVRRRLVQEGINPDSFQLSSRTWGQRIANTCFIEHNDKYYVEVIFLKSGPTKYLLDGVETPKYMIEGLSEERVEAEQGGLNKKVIIRTFGVDSITAITVNKQRYTDLFFKRSLI